MKNFLWFLNSKPKDEREREIYNKASRRAAAVSVEILLIAWVFHPLNMTISGNNIALTDLGIVAPVICIVGYFVGWLSVRKEDLSARSNKFLP